MDEPGKYVIEERKFYQKELVWGQVRWMQDLMGQSSADINLVQVLDLFGVKLARFAAIVLVEEGVTQSKKVNEQGGEGLDELEKFLLGALTPSIAKRVVADFFDLTNLAGLLEVVLEKSGSRLSQEKQTATGSPTA